MIVDEAFIDTEAEHSLLALPTLPDNIIVLRSFGKFFGLAGLRLGFVFAEPSLLAALTGDLSYSGSAQLNGQDIAKASPIGLSFDSIGVFFQVLENELKIHIKRTC